VACNSKYRRLVYPPEPVIFLPLFQDYDDEVVIHARVAGDPRAFAATVEKTLHRLNPELPLYGVTTLRSSMRLGSLFERLAGASAGAFGLLALLIAAVGIYGVVDYTTRQRTREFGVRMALGAKPGALYRLVLGHGLRLASIGLGAGLALSLLLVRFLQSLLFGVSELEVPTIAVVSLGLCAVALVACFVPTRRATKIDPTVALRYE
jgi:predicted lysophospholipase L1 biosynthesis ABC-type transport system permease subunit